MRQIEENGQNDWVEVFDDVDAEIDVDTGAIMGPTRLPRAYHTPLLRMIAL